MIKQGEVYWIAMEPPTGSGPGYRHPHVVIQNNLFNASKLRTVVVCALTSNLQRGRSPGNVVLKRGEAGLPRACVVNVTRVFAVDKAELSEKIGTLSDERVLQVLEGIDLVMRPRTP